MKNQESPAYDLRRRVAESILGSITFRTDGRGFCICPGAALHTTPTALRHCEVHLDGVPTIHCLHQTCKNAVEVTNRVLRSRIGAVQVFATQSSVGKWTKRSGQKPQITDDQGLRLKTASSRNWILQHYLVKQEEFSLSSPTVLCQSLEEHWRLDVALFEPNDVLWIGDVYSSGERAHSQCFRTATESAKGERPSGCFICSNAFSSGASSRANKNIVSQRIWLLRVTP